MTSDVYGVANFVSTVANPVIPTSDMTAVSTSTFQGSHYYPGGTYPASQPYGNQSNIAQSFYGVEPGASPYHTFPQAYSNVYASSVPQAFDYMSMGYYPQQYSSYYSGAPGYPSVLSSPAAQYPLAAQLSQTGVTIPQHRKESSENGTKVETPKKSKGKKRKREPVSPSLPEHQFERVFIWELDETLILFNSLIQGQYAQKSRKNPGTVVGAGCKMQKIYSTIGEMYFFFQDLEECDQVNLEDTVSDDTGQDLSTYNFASDGFCSSGKNPSTTSIAGLASFPFGGPPTPSSCGRGSMDWLRKLAFRFRKIRELYNTYKDNTRGLISVNCDMDHFIRLRCEIESLVDSWHGLATKCLSLITARSKTANVVVSSQSLVTALVKLLLYDMAPAVLPENVYNSTKLGKLACYERIVQRFGKKCTFVVIGGKEEEECIARQLRLPFWKVSSVTDLNMLHHALDLGHL